MSHHNHPPKRTIVPFGPQHPVLPEPIHLDLVLEDEKIVEAIPSIGYIHRGLELLAEKIEYTEFVSVAERICGICSFIHGLGYVQAVEEIMQHDVPTRAKYLRTMWSEFSRMQSHLLWLGLAADAFGFENLFMLSWKVRESILDIFEETTGGRVIFNVCQVGGLRKNVETDTLRRIKKDLDAIEIQIRNVCGVFLNDPSTKHRLVGVGVLSKEMAHELGAVGPMLRASGIAKDTRMLGYAAYDQVKFDIITETAGDCYARVLVRINELYQSLSIIRQIIDKIPEEQVVFNRPKGNPNGESFMRLEQPRGEVLYYAKGNGSKNLERFRARTPTFANIAPMLHVLKGQELADVPNIILTIDPCISCTER